MEFLNPKKKKYNFDKFLEDDAPEKPTTVYDDPEWKDLVETVKRQAEEDLEENNKPKFLRRNTYTDMPKKSVEPEQVELNIRLTLPKVKWDKVKGVKKSLNKVKKKLPPLSRSSLKQYIRTLGVKRILVGLFVISLLFFGWSNFFNKDTTNKNTAESSSQQIVAEEPVSHDVPFKIFLPQAIAKDAVSYNSNKNFAKFDGQINGVAVSVTQQPLPDNFKSNPTTSLEELAKQMNASESIESTTSGTIYVQQTGQGAQTAIFVRDNILGFVRTQSEVGASKIAIYIDSLN